MVGFETNYFLKALDTPIHPESKNQSPPSNSPRFKTPREFKKFFYNCPQNAVLAAISVPTEGIILRILTFHFDHTAPLSFPAKKGVLNTVKCFLHHPINKSPSYLSLIKEEGLGLFKGGGSRISYVLTGQGSRIFLMEQMGKEPLGLLAVVAMQNCLYPFSVYSNSRQIGKTHFESLNVARKNLTNKRGHLSFLSRNFGAIVCYYPGLLIKEKFSTTYGEYTSTVAGAIVSLITATGMNVFCKCYFTPGKASSEVRTVMAFRGGPGIICSMGVHLYIF